VTLTVNATANSLSLGTYGPTTITFTNSDTGQGTQTRTATLVVNPPGPALEVTPPDNMTASGTRLGPFKFSPPTPPATAFDYMLSATTGTLSYTITTPSWLKAAPASGKATTKPIKIAFTINAAVADKFPAGLQGGTVSFTNTTNGQGNTTRSATLTVNPKDFEITVEAAADGTVTLNGVGSVKGKVAAMFAEGTTVPVTATANPGFQFSHWTEAGKLISPPPGPSFTYTLPVPGTAVTLEAFFVKN
jgi:hypothetical protein